MLSYELLISWIFSPVKQKHLVSFLLSHQGKLHEMFQGISNPQLYYSSLFFFSNNMKRVGRNKCVKEGNTHFRKTRRKRQVEAKKELSVI